MTIDYSSKVQVGAAPEVANRGLLRPPVVYLGSVLLGLGLDIAIPAQLMPRNMTILVGLSATTLGIALLMFSIRELRAANTPVPGNRPTSVVVQSGPYRFSRNPIYLAFSIVQLGIASWFNSPWLLAALVCSVGTMSLIVIPREERYLETYFGPEYRAYKVSTRRWL